MFKKGWEEVKTYKKCKYQQDDGDLSSCSFPFI